MSKNMSTPTQFETMMHRVALLTMSVSLVFAACNDPASSSADASLPDLSGLGVDSNVLPNDVGIMLDISLDASNGRDAWTNTDSGAIQTGGEQVVIMEDGITFTCQPTLCQDKLLECGDCIDNDGDGKTDWRDPECLGPCDNTEGAGLSSGVGGETRQTCSLDCYFDFGNGSGNDKCRWDHRCDPLSPESSCEYDSERLGTRDCPDRQEPTCEDVCLEITPNGCDCFGCCTFPPLSDAGPNGAPAYVWIGHQDEQNNSTCTLDALTNETSCPRCTPVADCLNECGRCELCLGKTELPPDCLDSPNPNEENARCSEDVTPCGQPNDAPCPDGFYCVTGCCQGILSNF
ncbi:MAG: hypothetical protein ACPGQS_12580 [Bradymonadia bacterium]